MSIKVKGTVYTCVAQDSTEVSKLFGSLGQTSNTESDKLTICLSEIKNYDSENLISAGGFRCKRDVRDFMF